VRMIVPKWTSLTTLIAHRVFRSNASATILTRVFGSNHNSLVHKTMIPIRESETTLTRDRAASVKSGRPVFDAKEQFGFPEPQGKHDSLPREN
jgi:hypothetical protein